MESLANYPVFENDPAQENILLREQLASAMQLISQLSTSSQATDPNDHAYFYTERRLQKVYFKDINWIQAERNYVYIYTEYGYLTVHQPISKIEELLPRHLFSRIHKSYIVANYKIDFIGKGLVGIKRDQQVKTFPLGAQFKKPFIQLVKRP